jgi:hypothetical protein
VHEKSVGKNAAKMTDDQEKKVRDLSQTFGEIR